MKNYLVTWFYREDKKDASFYPQVGGSTCSTEIQDIYWKCVYDFFSSAQLCNTNVHFVFFTNVEELPSDMCGVNLKEFFKRGNIQVIRKELSAKTPKDWHKAWRNQFYVFDILDYFKDGAEGNILILDSDCLIRKPLNSLFQKIEKEGVVLYDYGYPEKAWLNGIKIAQMKKLYEEFYGGGVDGLTYKCGELIAVRSDVIAELMDVYHELWKFNYEKYLQKKIKLNEEAHFLSFIFYRMGYINSYANKYIKRMWTAFEYDNVCKDDMKLAIWHLPAEKKYGFVKIFEWFKKRRRTKNEYLKYSDKVLSISKSAKIRKIKKYIQLKQETYFDEELMKNKIIALFKSKYQKLKCRGRN